MPIQKWKIGAHEGTLSPGPKEDQTPSGKQLRARSLDQASGACDKTAWTQKGSSSITLWLCGLLNT